MAVVQVRPSLTEWVALPNTVRQAMPLVRVWQAELESEAQERATKEARRRTP